MLDGTAACLAPRTGERAGAGAGEAECFGSMEPELGADVDAMGVASGLLLTGLDGGDNRAGSTGTGDVGGTIGHVGVGSDDGNGEADRDGTGDTDGNDGGTADEPGNTGNGNTGVSVGVGSDDDGEADRDGTGNTDGNDGGGGGKIFGLTRLTGSGGTARLTGSGGSTGLTGLTGSGNEGCGDVTEFAGGRTIGGRE